MNFLKNFSSVLFLFISISSFSQISGKVTDTVGNPLQNVNVYAEHTFNGTTTNKNGEFKLNVDIEDQSVIIFKFLGFETQKIEVTSENSTEYLEVEMIDKVTSLDDVVIQNDEDPAIAIIENAIEARKKNLARIKQFKAEFYSKGLWEVENVPEKIMGQEVGDMGGSLDSTRSGVVYLSETVSDIAYQSPDKFKENITASKVSGDDNGFSFNSAQDFDVSFYRNTVDLGKNLVSPIANFAFNYYDYELEGTFYDDNGFLINKVKVIPKRPNDVVFSGYIYIIEDTWEIYGVELKTTGKSIQVEVVEKINFNQTFTYSEANEFWVLFSQKIDFNWKIFGISGEGSFVASYKNYDFEPNFEKDFFSKAVVTFEENANQKDSLYWERNRPVPLTELEARDYEKKDSIQTVRNSPAYKDSVDTARNKFKFLDPVFGYRWQNSFTHQEAGFGGLTGLRHNTVQGFNINTDFYFRQKDTAGTYRKFWEVRSDVSYGFSDERFRASATFRKKFNNFSDPYLSISGGIKTEQINNTNPISPLVSSVASVFFERNYLKLYDKIFARVAYSEEFWNGIQLNTGLEFQRRKALINATNSQIIGDKNGGFTSNNPLAPLDFGSKLFPSHNILKFNLSGRIHFNQTYTLTPNGKYNNYSNKYPVLSFNYQKGFLSDINDYNFDVLKTRITHDFDISRFGNFAYSLNGGLFFNADDISFLDYKHFDGNQTRIGSSANYLNKFNLLPYYALSTNENYADVHFEHNFNGYILNKIPLLNKLNFNLIAGAKSLFTTDNKPYSEFSLGLDNLGFGQIRFFRIDYVKPYQGGWQSGAFIFGLNFIGDL